MDNNFKAVIEAIVKVNQPELQKEMERLKKSVKSIPIDVRLDLGKAMKEAQSKLRNQSTSAGAQEVLGMGEKLVTSHVGKTKAEMQGVVDTMNQLNAANVKTTASTKQVDKALQDTGKSSKTLGEHLSASVKQFVYYQIAIRGMYEALNQLRLGVQYIKDLDKEMTSIQMITGQSETSINKLAMSYNKLGSEMGVSTLEIAKGSLEFIRQGKTAEETALLIKNSTQLSKLANMDSAASSEALTSIMNGFKMEVEETTDVVNKLISIKFVETYSNIWVN
jgi:hypothetical protein